MRKGIARQGMGDDDDDDWISLKNVEFLSFFFRNSKELCTEIEKKNCTEFFKNPDYLTNCTNILENYGNSIENYPPFTKFCEKNPLENCKHSLKSVKLL